MTGTLEIGTPAVPDRLFTSYHLRDENPIAYHFE
jgi:hypothetical protein